MKNIKIIFQLIMLVGITGLAGCGEDVDDGKIEVTLVDSQLAAVAMRGSWGQASNAVLPAGTTEGVLDKLSLRFTITDDYAPDAFEASGEVAMDYLFKPGSGTWKWVDGSTTQIELVGVSPVTLINVAEDGQSFRLSFTYNGDSEGGRSSGIGEYSVTLNKIAP